VYMNALPTRPFEKEKAAVFLDLVKQNNMSGILDMLYDDRLLVYQFDYVNCSNIVSTTLQHCT
jgi:hypothetical protein